MYWRDFDLTYQANDLSWASLREASTEVISDITALNYIESNTFVNDSLAPILTSEKSTYLFGDDFATVNASPILEVGLNVDDALQANILSDVIAIKLEVDYQIVPILTTSPYIESKAKSSDSLASTIVNPLIINSIYSEELVYPVLSDVVSFLNQFSEDVLSVLISDDAFSKALQDTILRYLSDTPSWNIAIIKEKQSEGTWIEKPIYMKQIDKSWL